MNMTRKQEILVLLAEECAEVAQECAKGLRFPEDLEKRRNDLTAEVADLLAVLDYAMEDNLVCRYSLRQGKDAKIEKMKKFTEHLQGLAPIRKG